MTSIGTIVIVGAGLAAAAAAETLRAEGFDGRIVMIGDEAEPPYERPPLTKDYLRGESGFAAAVVHPRSWYDDQRIELMLRTLVSGLDPATRSVKLGDGSRVGFDRLLLATGSDPRTLDVRGDHLDGVHVLRTRGHADAIREAISPARQVVVVGGGWIASEVAASARQLGASVTMVAPSTVPLEKVLGLEVGTVYRALHLEHGVRIVAGRRVVGFDGETAVERVALDDGTTIDADLVVVGVGATPRVELARRAGLAVGDGVLVDSDLETDAPGIFAAGDIAAAWHPIFGRRIRVEHWDNARRQGRAAARNMLGMREPYERIPNMYSDQFDLGMEYAGHAPTWDRVVFRGDPATREFLAFWLDGDRVVAGMNANIWKVNGAIAEIVRSKASVDVGRLVDPNVPLDEVGLHPVVAMS